jgi:hypothetical protein
MSTLTWWREFYACKSAALRKAILCKAHLKFSEEVCPQEIMNLGNKRFCSSPTPRTPRCPDRGQKSEFNQVNQDPILRLLNLQLQRQRCMYVVG